MRFLPLLALAACLPMEPDTEPIIDGWTFEPRGDGVKVTWEFGGEATGPLAGLMAMMIEGMVGPQFEQGLVRLKTISETAAVPGGPGVDGSAEEG